MHSVFFHDPVVNKRVIILATLCNELLEEYTDSMTKQSLCTMHIKMIVRSVEISVTGFSVRISSDNN